MFRRFVTLVTVMTMAGFTPASVAKTDAAADPSAAAARRTPPRLSFVQGEVSFWRPGAEDWATARINTALEAGDNLYTGAGANLEVQVGPMAFLRAGEQTQLGLEGQEPDFLQLKVTSGHAALDVRELDPGQTVELDTPNAAVSIERPGYYRVDVTADSTALISRRGGHATVTPAGAAPIDVSGNQEAIIQGTESAQVATYEAPKLDDWDWWNYNRTDSLLASGSGSYLPPDMYGSQELSRYGTWQNADPYGRVWVPSGVGPTWAPYSTGEWMWDPYYNWTWVDTAPWGWAPYHYGRWVHWNNRWGWAPGPLVAGPVWEPALVGFLGFPGFSVGVGFGTPIGWVALGWGEPLWPWWGGVGFIGTPCWDGWFGPHFSHHRDFDNIHAPHGVVAVGRHRFGNGDVGRARIGNILHSVGARDFQPIHGALPVRAGPQSLVAAAGRGIRPPDRVMDRRVVATRAPRMPAVTHNPAAMRLASAMNPAPRLVPAVQRRMTATASSNLRQFRQAPTTFHSGNARQFATLPRGNARATAPINTSSRFTPPPLPRGGRGGASLHQAPPQQYANRQGNFAFASRLGPARVESRRPAGPARSFGATNSPRAPGTQVPALQRQQGSSPRRVQQPAPTRLASVPPRGPEPRFSRPAAMPGRVFQPRVASPRVAPPRVVQPQIASPRFAAPAMSAPRFAAPRGPAFGPSFRAPSGVGGGRFGGGEFGGRSGGGNFGGARFDGAGRVRGGFPRR